MQSPFNYRASLDTVPLEVLNHIFFLTSSEDLDLSLLLVSHAMSWKLLDHPIVKTVRAFWRIGQTPLKFGRLVQNPMPMPLGSLQLHRLHCDDGERERIREEVLASAWCTPGFVKRMQVAFIRRMVKELWDPFLQRDGLGKCARSQPAFWALLDRVAYGGLRMEEENMEICLTDNETRYSWTRIRIWPWQGRIVIRDQLLNRSFEKTLPFLQGVLVEKKCVEGAVAGRIAV